MAAQHLLEQAIPKFIGGVFTAFFVALVVFAFNKMRNDVLESRLRTAFSKHAAYIDFKHSLFGIQVSNVTATEVVIRRAFLTAENRLKYPLEYGGHKDIAPDDEPETPLNVYGAESGGLSDEEERGFKRLPPFCGGVWVTNALPPAGVRFIGCTVILEYRSIFGAHRLMELHAEAETIASLNDALNERH